MEPYLVRFGGAGAVLPFLFVVRRIWTFTLLPPAENVDNLDDVDPGSDDFTKIIVSHMIEIGCSRFHSKLIYLKVSSFRNVCSFEIFSPLTVLNLNVSHLVIASQLLQ